MIKSLLINIYRININYSIMGKFEISLRKNGEYQFTLKAGNGQVILVSESYTTKASCKNGIESVKKNATDDARFEKKVSKNGKPYFELKAGNNQIIGVSELYESEASCKNGIESVKKNAPEAQITDLTEEK